MSSLTNPSLAKSLRQYMQSTFRIGHGTVSPRSLYGIQVPELKVALNEAYHYKIGANEFDPDVVFPEVLTLSNQLSTILQQLTPAQETKFENHILHCLASMVYGSNMIERAGGDSDSTFGAVYGNLPRKGSGRTRRDRRNEGRVPATVPQTARRHFPGLAQLP